MAKKNKQRSTARVAPEAIVETTDKDAVVEEQAPPAAEPRPTRAPKISRSQAASERLEDEYAYIVGDLRRVFILAAVMFALLIILNVVLGRLGG